MRDRPLKERRLKYYESHIIIKNYMKAPIAYSIFENSIVLIDQEFREIPITAVEDIDLRYVIADFIQNRLASEFPLLDQRMVQAFREKTRSQWQPSDP